METTGTCIRLAAIAINYHDGNSGYNSLLSRAFSGGNPFDGGILGHNFLLSGPFSGNPFDGWI
jgi:hypothetical protein